MFTISNTRITDYELFLFQVKVPARRTTYWCTKFKLSDFADLRSPNHIVAVCSFANYSIE